jgi:hypothetical protein
MAKAIARFSFAARGLDESTQPLPGLVDGEVKVLAHTPNLDSGTRGDEPT